jgi:hypothetical protein
MRQQIHGSGKYHFDEVVIKQIVWTLTIKSRRWSVEYHIPLLRWKWKTVSGVKHWSTPYILQAVHQQSMYKFALSVSNTDAEVRLSHTCKRCERWEMWKLCSHMTLHMKSTQTIWIDIFAVLRYFESYPPDPSKVPKQNIILQHLILLTWFACL